MGWGQDSKNGGSTILDPTWGNQNILDLYIQINIQIFVRRVEHNDQEKCLTQPKKINPSTSKIVCLKRIYPSLWSLILYIADTIHLSI